MSSRRNFDSKMNVRMLSGSALKIIAVITMAIDHTAAFLFYYQDWAFAHLFTYHGKAFTWYMLFRCIGRMAFPLFTFLVVEGFVHTKNRFNYGRNLFLFALVSEIPWALLHGGLHWVGHNVMFTLFWGFLGLCAVERYRFSKARQAFVLIFMLAFAFVFRADYNGSGFAFIIMLYALRHHLLLQTIVGCCMLPMKWIAGLAFIPISMYNGQRGFIRGTLAKYCFYAFYPAHLLLLYFLAAMYAK